MRIRLEYEDGSRLSPVQVARLLCDLEGVVFAGATIFEAIYGRLPRLELLIHLDYSSLIYIDRGVRAERLPPSKYYDLRVERLSYNSPPKLELSVRASLDLQKCLKTIFDFIEHLIHRKQHGQLLAVEVELGRQQAIAAAIKNSKDVMRLLDHLPIEAREEAQIGLINRIAPLVDESGDYAPLRRLSTNGPDGA